MLDIWSNTGKDRGSDPKHVSDSFDTFPLELELWPWSFTERCLMTSIREHDEVSSFVYLVNDSQSEADVKRHELHLESWSNIFGKPKPPAAPELEPPKLLVASSLLNALPLNIRGLCSIWKNNISGTEVTNLMPHNEAEESVRQAISSCSQMTVQFREELKEARLLRKTTVGRHYVKILKKRRKELQVPGGHLWQWRRQDPDEALKMLNMELDHWKKCKLPRNCKDCRFI